MSDTYNVADLFDAAQDVLDILDEIRGDSLLDEENRLNGEDR